MLTLLFFLAYSCKNTPPLINKLAVYQDDSSKELAFTYGNNLLTIFHYGQEKYKPSFFPVNTIDGIRITRGWPDDPAPFEPVDHPHQLGLWFNFGDVNGIDFWNNSDSIPPNKKKEYGRIVNMRVLLEVMNDTSASFSVNNFWISEPGDSLLEENSSFKIELGIDFWLLEKTTTLRALQDITFNDNKEGLFAIRMAREFQSDLNKADYILDSNLHSSGQKLSKDEGKSGVYLGSNGKKGKQVWGTANEWIVLSGILNADTVSIAIFDHPLNFGHPPYWHARDYGLFSVNNFGRKSFNPGLDALSLQLKKGEQTILKHSIIIKNNGPVNESQVKYFYDKFKGNSND